LLWRASLIDILVRGLQNGLLGLFLQDAILLASLGGGCPIGIWYTLRVWFSVILPSTLPLLLVHYNLY
jgi:hypothetical protein